MQRQEVPGDFWDTDEEMAEHMGENTPDEDTDMSDGQLSPRQDFGSSWSDDETGEEFSGPSEGGIEASPEDALFDWDPSVTGGSESEEDVDGVGQEPNAFGEKHSSKDSDDAGSDLDLFADDQDEDGEEDEYDDQDGYEDGEEDEYDDIDTSEGEDEDEADNDGSNQTDYENSDTPSHLNSSKMSQRYLDSEHSGIGYRFNKELSGGGNDGTSEPSDSDPMEEVSDDDHGKGHWPKSEFFGRETPGQSETSSSDPMEEDIEDVAARPEKVVTSSDDMDMDNEGMRDDELDDRLTAAMATKLPDVVEFIIDSLKVAPNHADKDGIEKWVNKHIPEKLIRDHMSHMLRGKDGRWSAAKDAEVKRYEKMVKPSSAQGPTKDNFRVHMNARLLRRSQWNKRAAIVFIKSFCHKHTGWDRERVKSGFWTHMRTVLRHYKKESSGETDKDVLEKQHSRRNGRQKTLFKQRLAVLEAYKSLRHLIPLLHRIGHRGMSPDLSDSEHVPRGKLTSKIPYRRQRLLWRSDDLTTLLHDLDSIYKYMRRRDGKKDHGNPGRIRQDATGDLVATDATAPRNLPVNCYDIMWYEGLDEADVEELDATESGPRDLKLPSTFKE
ncbi:hypothetical protein AURDEDRAFT_177618 [Auricularia subglabra TFB-10046 SS5]|uniref:Uncharacterized protein n=1 Tax=Auricularia subglabra (strain TFB-10046 / SS5) TaxID=717982 RepID=J0D3P3_AURST|nr:hypothetical protein AURDEDRAFT_177618 [Auricularia subglabra TFB-10046 SS5]